MIVDARPHLDLFDLDDLLALACLSGFFLFLVFVFAVVEHLGHGRTGIGRNLDQIKARGHGAGERIGNRHHADIITIFIDQSHFADPDVLIYPWTGWLALRRGPHWASYWAVSFVCFRSRAMTPLAASALSIEAAVASRDIRKETAASQVSGPIYLVSFAPTEPPTPGLTLTRSLSASARRSRGSRARACRAVSRRR